MSLHYNLVWALVALVQAPVFLVQVLVDLVQAHLPQGGLISVVSSGARLWVVWICFVGVCERGEEERGVLFTGCLWIGGRLGCIRAKWVSWLY